MHEWITEENCTFSVLHVQSHPSANRTQKSHIVLFQNSHFNILFNHYRWYHTKMWRNKNKVVTSFMCTMINMALLWEGLVECRFQLNEDPPTLHSHVGKLKTLWSACAVVYLATFCPTLPPLLTCLVFCDLHRKPECDIRIQLPQVSKEHCRIDLNENKEVTITIFHLNSLFILLVHL